MQYMLSNGRTLKDKDKSNNIHIDKLKGKNQTLGRGEQTRIGISKKCMLYTYIYCIYKCIMYTLTLFWSFLQYHKLPTIWKKGCNDTDLFIAGSPRTL